MTALAEEVGISVSACHRRLREVERSGIITGYRVQVDPVAVGLGFRALVFVTMREGDAEMIEQFEAALRAAPQIVEAHRLFGDPDYLLRVATRDLDSFQRLYDEMLSRLPGVLRLTTTLIMKEIVTDRALPIP